MLTLINIKLKKQQHYVPYVCWPFKQTAYILKDTGKHRCNLALRRKCHARFSKRKNDHLNKNFWLKLYLTGISSFILITGQDLSSSTYKLRYL